MPARSKSTQNAWTLWREVNHSRLTDCHSLPIPFVQQYLGIASSFTAVRRWYYKNSLTKTSNGILTALLWCGDFLNKLSLKDYKPAKPMEQFMGNFGCCEFRGTLRLLHSFTYCGVTTWRLPSALLCCFENALLHQGIFFRSWTLYAAWCKLE